MLLSFTVIQDTPASGFIDTFFSILQNAVDDIVDLISLQIRDLIKWFFSETKDPIFLAINAFEDIGACSSAF